MIRLSTVFFVIIAIIEENNATIKSQCSGVPTIQRLDCHPGIHSSEHECLSRGCCWSESNSTEYEGAPSCYFPPGYSTYYVNSTKVTHRGYKYDLIKHDLKYKCDEAKHIQAEIIKETKTRLRFRITIPSQPDRWEPPIELGKPDKYVPDETDYKVDVDKQQFGIKVSRAHNPKQILIDSTGLLAPSLIVSDYFLQVTFRLTADQAYGPGELETEFPHSLNKWLRTGLWAYDGSPMKNVNLYGTHNFVLGQYKDGTAFGLFFLNSNAQEVAWTPLPSLTYRTIGGIMDFFLLTGPKPADVIEQYYNLIGLPMLPPYWSLGFQLCRYGAENLNYINKVLKRNQDADIPIDGQWFDIDYMDGYKDWTVDSKNYGSMGTFIRNELHARYGMKAVIIADPAISTEGGPGYLPYLSGLKLGVFINDSITKQPIEGVVWPGETVFPDFSHPAAEMWWYSSANEFRKNVPFDGLWIDMNEVANFVDGTSRGCQGWNILDHPQFVPKIIDHNLFRKTLCPSAMHYDTSHYNRHNLYGHDESQVTYQVLKKISPHKRPFILSRSTFASTGRYASHWTGDVHSSWENMRTTITQLINFNIFGIPMIGSDICGFHGNASEELCIRWSQLGAFYPFSRNHNGKGQRDQDPAAWSPKAQEAIRDVIKMRYHLLPYLYSLFFRAHLNGSTVVRALSFEFPEDINTHKIKEQFMLGSCLLVTPVLYEGHTSVNGYLPAGPWVNTLNGERIPSCGQMVNLKAPLNKIPILLRGGCIFPMQKTAKTTSLARKDGFNIVAVLSQLDDGTYKAGRDARAEGELFWDNGEETDMVYLHVEFTIKNRQMKIIPTTNGPDCTHNIDYKELRLWVVKIHGFTKSPNCVLVNRRGAKFEFNEKDQTLTVNIHLPVGVDDYVTVEWKFK